MVWPGSILHPPSAMVHYAPPKYGVLDPICFLGNENLECKGLVGCCISSNFAKGQN